VRVWRLGPDGVCNSIDFNSPDAAQGSCYTGMQMEAGGKISAVTCNPAIRGCMALTTPSRLRVMDVEIGREFSSRDCEADGGVHSMCWTPTGASCLLSLKNRTIITHDPRAPTLAATAFPGHSTVSPNRLAYLKGNHFCSTGKGAGRTRTRTHALALDIALSRVTCVRSWLTPSPRRHPRNSVVRRPQLLLPLWQLHCRHWQRHAAAAVRC